MDIPTSDNMRPVKKTINCLTTDVFILDVVADYEGNPEIQALVAKYGSTPGSKGKIESPEELRDYQQAFSRVHTRRYSGGSGSNFIRTMARLAPIEGDFHGVIGDNEGGDIIRQSFAGTKIRLHEIQGDVAPEHAISFVIVWPDSQRGIKTDLGNARRLVKPEYFTREVVEPHNLIALQGSILIKFDPEVFHAISKHRNDCRIRSALALPTSAFSPEIVNSIRSSANYVLSNVNELGYPEGLNIDGLDKRYTDLDSENLQRARHYMIAEALYRLQDQQRDYSDKALHSLGFGPQSAMITDDKNGCHIVTTKALSHVNAIPDEMIKFTNKLGAGDCGFGAYVFAKEFLNFDDIKAASFAMLMSAAKIGYDGAVMDDPLTEIAKIDPEMADEVSRIISPSWQDRVNQI